MKNTATLGQIQKLLSLLEGIPSEQVQKSLESGLLSEIIRSGELTTVKENHLQEKFIDGWQIILKTVQPEEIFITCPRDTCTYYSDQRNTKYQVKVWKGNYGHWKAKGGHVSHGGFMPKDAMLLLEYYDTRNCEEGGCPCHGRFCSRPNGVDMNLAEPIDCERWNKETLEGKGDYGRTVLLDIFSVRKDS